MKDLEMRELKEVIQSANINFLFGSGLSRPFLPLLGDIETKLNEAQDDAERETQYKRYLTEVMLPNKHILETSSLDEEQSKNLKETKDAYTKFFTTISNLLINRKISLLSKQVNIFSTNIDIFMEHILEELKIEYNDGFSGRINPIFSISNFKKSIFQRSLHFDHKAEVPVFNIIKVHGSLNWKYKNEAKNEITYSHQLDHISDSMSGSSGDDFLDAYNKILAVNPQEAKHLESVLNVYYSELLRLYSSELERENALLFVMGFSMEDQHIREITLRAAKSNPTLRVFLFCYEADDKDKMSSKMKISSHPNIQIVVPEKEGSPLDLNEISDVIKKATTTSIEIGIKKPEPN